MISNIKQIGIYSVLISLTVVSFVAAREPLAQYAGGVVTFVKEYSDAQDDMLKELRHEVFTEPLRANIAGDRANLSPTETIRLTNDERMKYGLDPLIRNELLDNAAKRKLQDMFDKQYFDHISPEGKGPGFVADQAGYSYVVIGENLAMGSFEADADLVAAWMKSQGHRENILSDRYTEIGVAVGHGTYDGERIWLAVQEFGKPAGACPTVNPELRNTIEKNKADVAATGAQITDMKKELETMSYATTQESAIYNEKVSAYNRIVSSYNTDIAELKKEIEAYNKAVRDFNSCAEQ